MSVNEILAWSGGGFLLLLTFIQVTPIKINPWSWFARKIGSAINKEVIEKVDSLERKVDEVDKKTNMISEKEDERNAVACRVKILRFGDELLHGNMHSKEHFDQILMEITEYQRYCDEHPDFKNHVTAHTTKKIENTYQHLLDINGFL